tara:strand:- start:1267 stop:1773 length:507 start_codon:yes stop_codon:yes gene_type:complete
MAKKCIPGIICIESFNLFLSIVIVSLLIYVYHVNYGSTKLPDNVNFISSNAQNENPIPQSNAINIPTQPMKHNFSQIGIITNDNNNSNTILPLMGRQLITSRNTWQYHGMSDQNNSVRLPVSFNGKNCMDEYGCDELTNGDTVFVEGYNDTFLVTLYEKNAFMYNSFL